MGCLRLLLAVVLIAPFTSHADVLDVAFFGGALGRAAYGAPSEFVRHTEWHNELRFSLPPETKVGLISQKTAGVAAVVLAPVRAYISYTRDNALEAGHAFATAVRYEAQTAASALIFSIDKVKQGGRARARTE